MTISCIRILECFVHVQDEVDEFLNNELHGGDSGFLDGVGLIFLKVGVADLIGGPALDASQLASCQHQHSGLVGAG